MNVSIKSLFDVRKISLLLALTFSVVSCQYTKGDIRLTGYGSNTLGGLLEVYINDQWGPVCGSNAFTITTATVACRQLGLGPAVDVVYYPDLRYGISGSDFAIGNVVCTGEEAHVLRCHYTLQPSCLPYQNIGVMCSSSALSYSGSLRILSEDGILSRGYLQMYLEGEWRHICQDQMTVEAANSACRQLGYTSAEKFTPSTIDSSLDTWSIDSVNCVDSPCFSTCTNVSSVSTCSQGVMVHCLFDETQYSAGNRSVCELTDSPHVSDVRLTALSDDGIQGVPQVYTGSNGWLKVCLDHFDLLVADVLCKQLGYPAAQRFEATQGYGSGVELACTGVESSARDCQQMSIVNQCTEFVNLRCLTDVPPYGSLRLFNGSGSAGSLHLFHGSLFVPLCDHDFGRNELTVACRQLGYETGVQVINNTLYGLSKFTTLPYDTVFRCDGSQDHLLDCVASGATPSLCRDPYDAVSIQCGEGMGGATRLEGGNDTSGWLQVELQDQWGAVCGVGFTHYDGHVACREMGFQTTSGFATRHPTSIEALPIHLTSLQCSGFETSLLSCPHQVADNGTCQHSHDIYLYCSREYPLSDGQMRIVGGVASHSGRLEISYHGLWMSMCGKLFNGVAANVACRQLGYTHVENYSRNGSATEHIFFGETVCRGDELELIECETDIHNKDLCGHQNIVWITCSSTRISDLASSTVLPSTTTNVRTVPEPSTDSVQPKSTSLLPFSDTYLYLMMAGVLLILLIIVVVTALICCICVYRKKHQRRFRSSSTNNPELDLGVDEPDMATSPRATNAAFLRISPLQSSDDISMADLKVCPRKELELRGLDLGGAVGGVSSREPSGVFEEVDFGLEAPPPRYDELDFEDSCEFEEDGALPTCLHECRKTDKQEREKEERELKFTTIRIGEL